jgi:hypothetical protein
MDLVVQLWICHEPAAGGAGMRAPPFGAAVLVAHCLLFIYLFLKICIWCFAGFLLRHTGLGLFSWYCTCFMGWASMAGLVGSYNVCYAYVKLNLRVTSRKVLIKNSRFDFPSPRPDPFRWDQLDSSRVLNLVLL